MRKTSGSFSVYGRIVLNLQNQGSLLDEHTSTPPCAHQETAENRRQRPRNLSLRRFWPKSTTATGSTLRTTGPTSETGKP